MLIHTYSKLSTGIKKNIHTVQLLKFTHDKTYMLLIMQESSIN
jgi:hypothetical protein